MLSMFHYREILNRKLMGSYTTELIFWFFSWRVRLMILAYTTRPLIHTSNLFVSYSRAIIILSLLFSEQEVTIHGLGAAINRAINLALQLEHRGQGTVKVM